jgi:hypothetical protein
MDGGGQGGIGGGIRGGNSKWIKEILESIIDDINDNDNYADKDYKELIIVYMQIIKTCKSIYNKFVNMH